MKKRKTKLWKKVLVGFMSFTMFLGNLSSLSIEAFAATEDVLDYEDESDLFTEDIDDMQDPDATGEEVIGEGLDNLEDQFADFEYDFSEPVEEEYVETAYYTVTYYDVDGSLLGSTEFAEGSALSMPQTGEGAYWTDEAGTEYFEGDEVYDNLSLFVNVDDIDLTEEEFDEFEELAEGQILVNAILADDEGNVLDSFRITSDMYLNHDDDNDAPVIEGYEFVSAMIDQSTVTEILVDETEEGLLEYTVDGVLLENDADIVLTYESTEFEYSIYAQVVDEDGRIIEGYEDAEFAEFDGTLDLADLQNPPVEVEGYDYVGASVGDEDVYSVTVEGGEGYYETDNGFVDIESDITVKLTYAEASVAVVLKATIVDEFGDEIDEKYTEMDMPEFGADGILVLDDPELPPVEDVKVKTGIIRSVKYTYVRATVDNKIVTAIKAEDAVGGLGTYYSYTTDGETWTKIKEDTTVLFEYTDGKKTTYTYSDGYVSVTATLQHANAIPDDAYFAVTPLTAGSGYDVDAYIAALNAKGATPEGKDDFQYTTANTLLYDIAFYTDETMTEEIEPSDGMVRTEIVFLQNQLKDELNATDQSDLIINHLSIDEGTLEEAGTTANASVSAGSISVEPVQADVSVAGESMAFMTDSYSVVSITQPSMELKYVEGSVSLDSLLGEAANFGIVADSYTQSVDTQTNLAVNTFSGGSDIGSDLSNDPGIMYIGTISNVLKLKSGSIVYYGDQNDSTKIIYTGGSGEAAALPKNSQEIADMVDSMITYASGAVPAAGDMMNELPAEGDPNHFTLDLSEAPDNITVHIDLDSGTLYDTIGKGGLNIKKSAGQTIIFHTSRSNVYLKGFRIWDGSSYEEANSFLPAPLDSQARGLIFDLRSAGSVTLENALAGVFIAPNAAVTVTGGACSGWLIAESVVGSAEWHFVSQNVPKPTLKDDNCKLELTITKHLIDDKTNKTADLSLWPKDGFDIKVSKYLCDADGDVNKGMGVASKAEDIPDLTGMVNGEITVNITKEQADQPVLVGTADFIGSEVWNKGYEYRDSHGTLLNKYIVFMYKVEEQACSDPNYTIDEKTYYVKYFINCKQIQNGTDIKYYVWVDGPHVANIVTDPNACQPKDIELTNHVSMPELIDIPVTKVWSDLSTSSDAHSNDTVLIQLTKKSGDEYVDVEGETLELPQNNSWSGTFEDLPKTDANGDLIEYSVREVSVNNVAIESDEGVNSVKIGNKTYIVSVTGNSENGFTVTNTPSGKGKLVIAKWGNVVSIGTGFGNDYQDLLRNIVFEVRNAETDELVATLTNDNRPGYRGRNYEVDDLDYGTYYIVEKNYDLENWSFVKAVCVVGTDAEPDDNATEFEEGRTPSFTFDENTNMISIRNTYSKPAALRIHKIVVNDFGSDNVHNILDQVVFRISNDTGYIVFTGFTGGAGYREGYAAGYGGYSGNAYDVEYNGNAQWTVYGLAAGSYTVSEVGDGVTFEYDASSDSSSDIADRQWSRVTHYDVTTDSETTSSNTRLGYDNVRSQAAVNVGQGTDAAVVSVGDINIGNDSHTQTVQVCNYYSKPSATMNVTKQYEGWDSDDSGKTFSFTIAASSTDATDSAGNAASIPMPENTTVSVSSDAPTASFGTVNYQYEGSYYYTITEDVPEGAVLITRDGKDYYLASDGILYDAQTVYVKVEVGQFDSTFKKTYTNLGEYDETFTYLGTTVTYYSDAEHTRVISTSASTKEAVAGADATFTNRKDERVERSGYKTWSDNNDQDGARPESITIRLLADGVDAGVEAKTVTADDNWSWTFTDLPKYNSSGTEIVYTVSEDPVTGYDTSYDGMNVTNSHTPRTTEVSGTKTWNDSNNTAGLRPASITIRLWKSVDGSDPVEVDHRDVTATDGWSWTFTGLPEKEGGKAITYTITEDAVTHYETSIDGFDVTNTYEPEYVKVNGTKVWDDASNQDGKRPHQVIINLYANGDQVDTTVVTGEGNSWTWGFDNLPKYSGGQVINYTVSEVAVTDYTTEITDGTLSENGDKTGITITNSYTPGTTGVSGRKEWQDSGNVDGKRPSSIIVVLYKTVEGTTSEVDRKEVSSSDNWLWSWDNLPAMESGKTITYSIDEEPAHEGDLDAYTKAISGYDITNTHIPEKISISGSKVWSDSNDQDGVRPDKVYVDLYKSGSDEVVATAVADEKSGWAWAFTDLPKYEAGQKITYSVTEREVAEYTSSPNRYVITATEGENANNTGLIFTNTHTPELTNMSGVKTWNDADNQDGVRPSSIVIRLYADGEPVSGQAITVTASDNWTWEFIGLPKNKDGKAIVYTVVEDPVPNYDPASITYGVNSETGYREAYVVNTHDPETIEIEGTKTWNDAENQDGKRPESITVNLLANGAVVRTATVTPDSKGDWKYSFTGLPRKSAGSDIAYTITEDPVSEYTTVINGYDITNTHKPATIDISGFKTWADNNDQDGKRTDTVTIRLLADGREIDSVTASAETEWRWNFTDLPEYSEGNRIAYTVTEDAVEGYATNPAAGYAVTTADSDEINNAELEFTNTHIPEKTEIGVIKVWNDDNNRDGARPAKVKINLLADGTPVDSVELPKADGSLSHTFSDLNKYTDGHEIVYTITEDAVEGYSTTYDTRDNVTTVTNSYTPGEKSISGKKVWDDNDDQDRLRPTSVQINLFADGQPYGNAIASAVSNWEWEFTHLPIYRSGEVGQKVVYTITETSIANYTTTIEKAEGNDDYYTITNNHVPVTVDISGSKDWEDSNDQDGVRPSSITIRLNADVAGFEERTTVAEAPKYEWSFTGLPRYKDGVEINYTISESPVTGYELTDITTGAKDANGNISNIVLTNTHEPATISVSGKKIWDDNNDQDRIRPGRISVQLYADGVPVPGMSKELTAENKWEWTFEDLPRYAGGNQINYTVKEETLPASSGYELVSETAGNRNADTGNIEGIELTNRHTPATLSISGIKDWDDNKNQDGVRPESVTVILYRVDGDVKTKVADQTTTANDSWAWSFTDLPKYDNGKLIRYALEEETVDKYALTSISDGQADQNGNLTNVIITNKYEPQTTGISGTKVWDDNSNQDGIRPSSITLNLYKNVENVRTFVKSTTITPSEAEAATDSWSWSFTDLPKYENEGKLITYTVEEVKVEGYETPAYSDDGLTITNKHVPETTKVEGIKIWDDANNQDGKRTASVTIRLYADGKEIDSKTLNGDPDWKFVFDELPKYRDNGTEIVYTVSEDKVTDYSTTITGNPGSANPYYTVTNSYTPGHVTISGTKDWIDGKDQDGLRPGAINIILFADGEQVATKTVTATDNWSWKFENMDEFKGGNRIVYSIQEEAVNAGELDAYEASITSTGEYTYTWSIINTHDPVTIDIEGTKTWEDNNNQDGARPDKIDVKLLADGKVIDSREVRADANGDWKYAFTGLPKYRDQGTEIVYTIEEDLVPGKNGKPYTASVNGYDITNSYDPETVEISGSKTWIDNDDQDGVRPKTITVKLMADGTQYDSKTVDVAADGSASWSFTNLPKYNDGKEIVYSIEEAQVQYYETKISGNDIINTHVPETVEIAGHKVWNDDNNNDNIRPASIEIQLLADGQAVEGKKLTVTADDNWSWKFTGLPKNAGGKAIMYSFAETSVEGYTTEISGSGTYEITVTNTHEREYVGLSVTKKWIGDAPAANSVTLTVEGRTANGAVVFPAKELTIKAPDWKYEIKAEDKLLPKYSNGEPIQYYIKEIVPDGAGFVQVDVNGARFDGATIAQKTDAEGNALEAEVYNLALTQITVQKQWEEDPGYYGGYDYIEVSLLADGQPVKTVQVKAADGWKYTFTDLPVYNAAGSKIKYTVVENSRLADYNAANGGLPVIDYSQLDEFGTIIIKNKLDPLALTINKLWLGDPAGTRHNDITVRIYSSVDLKGTTASVMDRIKKVIGIDSDKWYLYDTITLGESDNWTSTISNLPRYAFDGSSGGIVKVSYAVEEVNVPDGYTSVTNVDGSIATIINTGYTSVAGFKTWDDGSNVVGYRPGSAEFASMIVLYQDGKQYLTGSDSAHFRWLDTAGDSWSFEFYDLPSGHTYTIGELARVLGYGEPTIDGYTIKNPLEFTQIGVTKIWDDENNAYATRPASIAFRLLVNGAPANIAGVTPIVTLDNTNGASYVWRNLPVNDRNGNKIAYNVEEVAVPAGYSESVSRNGDMFVITNTFRPVDTQITVHKVWDDQDDAAGIRPASIEVALTRNGADIETVTLNASNGWSHTWSGLPTILADGTGTRAEYGVREVSQILGYSVSITGEGEVYTITNYYREPSTPPTPPNTPPETPETPNGSRSTQPPYTIPDEPTPLAGLSQVLGARRSPHNSVLGARRSPATGDASNAAAFAAAMASAGAMMGAWFAMRKKNRKG